MTEHPIQTTRHAVTISRHANARKQQRCIPDIVRDLVLDFGIASPAGDGADRFTFDRKSWRQVEAYLGLQAKHFAKYRNAFVLLSSDGVVITEGWVH